MEHLLKKDLEAQQAANNHSWDSEHLKKKMEE
jgi:hypothetical protein